MASLFTPEWLPSIQFTAARLQAYKLVDLIAMREHAIQALIHTEELKAVDDDMRSKFSLWNSLESISASFLRSSVGY
jgi:hypothetical protein